jgi:hypothetical protein
MTAAARLFRLPRSSGAWLVLAGAFALAAAVGVFVL